LSPPRAAAAQRAVLRPVPGRVRGAVAARAHRERHRGAARAPRVEVCRVVWANSDAPRSQTSRTLRPTPQTTTRERARAATRARARGDDGAADGGGRDARDVGISST